MKPHYSRNTGFLGITLFVSMVLPACGSSDSGSSTLEDMSMSVTSEGPVILNVDVLMWSESELELDYELTNGLSEPIVVFDEAPGDTFGSIDGIPKEEVGEVAFRDDQFIVFKGAVTRAECLNPVIPISVTGNDLMAGESLTGKLTQKLPLGNQCEPAPGAATDRIRFCVGYSRANDPDLIRARETAETQTGQTGRYVTRQLLNQQKSCVDLTL